jgi:hypothetical protein
MSESISGIRQEASQGPPVVFGVAQQRATEPRGPHDIYQQELSSLRVRQGMQSDCRHGTWLPREEDVTVTLWNFWCVTGRTTETALNSTTNGG